MRMTFLIIKKIGKNKSKSKIMSIINVKGIKKAVSGITRKRL